MSSASTSGSANFNDAVNGHGGQQSISDLAVAAQQLPTVAQQELEDNNNNDQQSPRYDSASAELPEGGVQESAAMVVDALATGETLAPVVVVTSSPASPPVMPSESEQQQPCQQTASPVQQQCNVTTVNLLPLLLDGDTGTDKMDADKSYSDSTCLARRTRTLGTFSSVATRYGGMQVAFGKRHAAATNPMTPSSLMPFPLLLSTHGIPLYGTLPRYALRVYHPARLRHAFAAESASPRCEGLPLANHQLVIDLLWHATDWHLLCSALRFYQGQSSHVQAAFDHGMLVAMDEALLERAHHIVKVFQQSSSSSDYGLHVMSTLPSFLNVFGTFITEGMCGDYVDNNTPLIHGHPL